MLSFNGVTFGPMDVVSISDLNRERAGTVDLKQNNATTESRPSSEKRPMEVDSTVRMIIDPEEFANLPPAYVLNPRVWAAQNRSACDTETSLHTDLLSDAERRRQERQICVFDIGYANKAIEAKASDTYCAPSTDAKDLSTGYIPRVIIAMQKVLDEAVVAALSQSSARSEARKKGMKKTKQAELPGCQVFDSMEEKTVSILYTDGGCVIIDYSDTKSNPLDPTFVCTFNEEDQDMELPSFVVKFKSTDYAAKLQVVGGRIARAIAKNRARTFTTEDSIRYWEKVAKRQENRHSK